MGPPKPSFLAPDPAHMPAELRDRPQWVSWRAVDRGGPDGKWTKVPYNARTGRKASATSTATWSSFDQAWHAYESGDYDGIGYVFAEGDPYCGVDLDGCRDPETGVLDAGATQIVSGLASYTELSVSGTGTHTIVRGKLPDRGRRKGQVEMYDRGRYFCFTGHVINGCPSTIEDRQHQLQALHASVFQTTEAQCLPGGQVSQSIEPDDERLLSRARAALNGAKFSALYDEGDISNYASASEADLALCAHVRFWTGDDAERIDRLFRGSALMRSKWDGPRGDTTYGAQTIAKALSSTPIASAPLRDASLSPHPPAQLTAEGQPWHGYYAMNDHGNALRLAWHLQGHVRWAGEALSWLLWTGTHWSRASDVVSEVRERIARLIGPLARAALLSLPVPAGKDPDAWTKVVATFVSNCGRTTWRRNALADLRDVDVIRTNPDDLDADPYLLTVLNGTLDLKTSELRDHQPADLITHCVQTRCVPDAQAPRFTRFISEVTRGDTDLIAFLQRMTGFVLVGEGTRRTKAFFFFYGPTDSGKGTFISLLVETLGPSLVRGISWGALAGPTTGGPNSELAQLEGKRLATIPDTGSNLKWDVETVKKLTGGDQLTVSEKNKPARTFYALVALLIAANDRPVLRGSGCEAMLERLHAVPFRQSFSDDPMKLALGRALPIDRGLKDHLLTHEREGILAWFVEGARIYCASGLGSCGAVEAERRNWGSDDAEWLSAMLAECSVTSRDPHPPADLATQKITAQDLQHALTHWLRDQGAAADVIARYVGDVRNVSREVNKLIDADTRFGDVIRDQKSEILAANHPKRGARAKAWGQIAWNEVGLGLLRRGLHVEGHDHG